MDKDTPFTFFFWMIVNINQQPQKKRTQFQNIIQDQFKKKQTQNKERNECTPFTHRTLSCLLRTPAS